MDIAPFSADVFIFPSIPSPQPRSAVDLMSDARANDSFLFLDDAISPTFDPEMPFFGQLASPSAPPMPFQPSLETAPGSVAVSRPTSLPSSAPLPSHHDLPSPADPFSRPPAVQTPSPTLTPTSSPLSPPVDAYFPDLRKMVASDCHQMSLPSLLFQSVMGPTTHVDVGSREMALLSRLRRLESAGGMQVKQLSAMFRSHSAGIEMERFQILYQATTSQYRDWLNLHFDQQRHNTMDRVERSLRLLEQRTESDRHERDVLSGVRRRAPLSRRMVRLLESWYENHQAHPYPSATVVEAMARSGDLTTDQVRKWFANRRIRNSNTKTLTEIARKNHHGKFSVMSGGRG